MTTLDRKLTLDTVSLGSLSISCTGQLLNISEFSDSQCLIIEHQCFFLKLLSLKYYLPSPVGQ